jgi:hypothetical protein
MNREGVGISKNAVVAPCEDERLEIITEDTR